MNNINQRRRIRARCAWLTGLLFAIASSGSFGHELESEHVLQDDTHSGETFATETDVRSLVRAFRQSGDDNYLDQAWQIVQPRLATNKRSPHRLVDAALVAQARHDFDLAIELITSAIDRSPHNDQAWLLLASVHLVRGETSKAEDACRELRSTPFITEVTCRARVALARNDFGHSKRQLDALLPILDRGTAHDVLMAWPQSVAGDLAVASGELQQAVDYYSRSLDIEESTQVRAALTDVLIAEGRLEEAQIVLAAGAPALPLVIRRLIVATRLGHLDTHSAEIADAEARFQAWIKAEDWLHAREMARFYLDVVDRPDVARRIATINLTLQKEPEDLRLEQRTRRL